MTADVERENDARSAALQQNAAVDRKVAAMRADEPDGLDSRTYVVGLPVIIVVSPGGTVSVEVDMSEAGITMVKDENATDGTIPEHVMISDSETVEAWRTRHNVSVMAK